MLACVEEEGAPGDCVPVGKHHTFELPFGGALPADNALLTNLDSVACEARGMFC